jgi:hypothetical protein
MAKPLDWNFELYVRGTDRERLPLEELGELLKKMSDVLGSPDHVRFGALRKGSARILANVREQAVEEVRLRLLQAKLPEGPQAAKAARMNAYFAEKGWSGELRSRDGALRVVFAGAANQPVFVERRVVKQQDTVVGKIIKIGGRDETVPMTLQTPAGEFVDVNVKGRALARELAPHLFGADLQFSGEATWVRDERGNWSCEDMLVTSSEAADGTPLAELFDKLADLPNNGWHRIEDPVEALRRWNSEEDS